MHMSQGLVRCYSATRRIDAKESLRYHFVCEQLQLLVLGVNLLQILQPLHALLLQLHEQPIRATIFQNGCSAENEREDELKLLQDLFVLEAATLTFLRALLPRRSGLCPVGLPKFCTVNRSESTKLERRSTCG